LTLLVSAGRTTMSALSDTLSERTELNTSDCSASTCSAASNAAARRAGLETSTPSAPLAPPPGETRTPLARRPERGARSLNGEKAEPVSEKSDSSLARVPTESARSNRPWLPAR
jgi:hypothetical protein